MATKRREAAPNQEWVLMYRGGLTRGQIAKLVGAATSTVGYHLAIARSTDPGLQAAHEAAASLKTRHASTAQGLDHTRELLAFVKATGRYPSRTGETLTERTLAAWLQRRREDARDGTLARASSVTRPAAENWARPRCRNWTGFCLAGKAAGDGVGNRASARRRMKLEKTLKTPLAPLQTGG